MDISWVGGIAVQHIDRVEELGQVALGFASIERPGLLESGCGKFCDLKYYLRATQSCNFISTSSCDGASTRLAVGWKSVTDQLTSCLVCQHSSPFRQDQKREGCC